MWICCALENQLRNTIDGNTDRKHAHLQSITELSVSSHYILTIQEDNIK